MYVYSKGDANNLLEMPTEESKAGAREAAGPEYSSRASVQSVVKRLRARQVEQWTMTTGA